MRVPKFRALDRLTGKMFPVGIIDYSIQSVYIEEPNGMYCERDFDEVELMQSTGLIDMYDKEIFNGDVLKTSDGKLAKVVWNKELACWEAEFLDEIVDLSEVADVKSNRSDCEIVGNIYENPELLGE